MRATGAVNALVTRFVSALAAVRRQFEFVCGDCERRPRCGLPPSDKCVVRAEQIASGDWKLRRRAKALNLVAGSAVSASAMKTRSGC